MSELENAEEIRRAERLLNYIQMASHGDTSMLAVEEFLAGYYQDGEMSVVRRFFCLLVAFDFIIISIVWFICAMLTGDSITDIFQKEILNYTIQFSLFDVEAAAICRCLSLILFYGILRINHWSAVALTTTCSCILLIVKVFIFDWIDSKEQVFQVLLILISFTLACGEAWLLDYRVIPQEQRAERIFSALAIINTPPETTEQAGTSSAATATLVNERTPLLSTLNSSEMASQTNESVTRASKVSDEELAKQNEQHHQLALDALRQAYDLLKSSDWQVEKVTKAGDSIYSLHREKFGKVFKLTACINYPAKALIDELFYNVTNIPKWNPTLLESRIVRKINAYTDISYQATASSAGGLVKSRDFVNLRSYRLLRNGEICSETEDVPSSDNEEEEEEGEASAGGSCDLNQGTTNLNSPHETLSNCLGGKDFHASAVFEEPPPLNVADNDDIEDIKVAKLYKSLNSRSKTKDKIWITAAVSVEDSAVPETIKYTRGQNIVAGFACKKIRGEEDSCIFEWLLALDMKGYIPRYILDTAYATFMSDYMKYLRAHVDDLRRKRNNALP